MKEFIINDPGQEQIVPQIKGVDGRLGMGNRETGRYVRTIVGGEEIAAFVPHPLPPANPALAIEAQRADRLREAERALGRLVLASEVTPSLDGFVHVFARKEAVISSQIEGVQASLVDLFRFEAEENASPDPDLEEVCTYLDALAYARGQLNDPRGLPLSARLLNEIHQRLMGGVRGSQKSPGEVRRSQNWIGGDRPGNAAFVPPPHHAVLDLLGDLERYVHGGNGLPPLIRTGLLHVQFETIHPYLDGNGRVGRLLITLLLEHLGLLDRPILCLSLFFKRHQAEYYRRLGAVRTDGDWEGWIDFFLEGVATVAEETVATFRELSVLISRDRARLHESPGGSGTEFRLFERLPGHPVINVGTVTRILDVSVPTAMRAIDILEKLGILAETTGKRRNRLFAYQAYIDKLRSDTELKPPR